MLFVFLIYIIYDMFHLQVSISYVSARRAGSDGSMPASGLAGLGFDPRRGSKFSFENF